MNTQKYGVGNVGLLWEVDRSLYKNKDTVSKSLIDHSKSHLNYNLCPHKQYTKNEILKKQEDIRGKKFRKDGVFFGSTILTLPKDFQGDKKAFFESAYKNLKKLYGLKDEDVVSAYVHEDESTPHLHFYFIPIKHEQEKDIISWDKVFPRKMYQTQHKLLKKEMEKELGVECNLLNGETLGIDVTKLNREDRITSMELTSKKEELSFAKEEIITIQIQKDELKEDVKELSDKISSLNEEISGLKKVYNRIKETIQSYMDRFKEIKPKAKETHFKSIFHQRKLESSLKHCEEKEDSIEAFLNKNDELPSDIPLDDFGVFQRNFDKLEDLLNNDELELY